MMNRFVFSASPWDSQRWNEFTGVKKLSFGDELKMSREGHPHYALSRKFMDAVDYAINDQQSYVVNQSSDLALKTFESLHPALVASVRKSHCFLIYIYIYIVVWYTSSSSNALRIS